MRLEKQSAVRIQRAFRYSRAKRRLAQLVDADSAEDTATMPASGWVELFDEASGYVYYYHMETGQSVWERPPEMDAATWTPEEASNENVGEWVEYWDENVGASYFYNVKTGEATWTTPTGYQSSCSNQEDTTSAEVWPLENGGAYYTLPQRSKLEPSSETGNQQLKAYGDQYEYGGDQAGVYNNNNGDGGYYYYYGDADGGEYPLEYADSNVNEQYEPVDTEYDINYKIYLTQVERDRQQEQQEDHKNPGNTNTQQDHKSNDS
ncbi:Spliceosomal protein FBP11/Splicing factor PRP40 [Phytophthora cinnamomi]|uniref:Spliceosomal protein FBP11/Splicing factor PRP40 n=1 Tax=Phytophthora cinnamomi TaxID=4785 RepID=UPI00355AB6E4|nr:Spliceosomal protein FBP11/Splicing factor PRP40 [Phytophthora cinnamomi]